MLPVWYETDQIKAIELQLFFWLAVSFLEADGVDTSHNYDQGVYTLRDTQSVTIF